MGIQGLLPLLKSIHKPTHLRNFSGQTLGVDAYGWLHRGTIACAIELAEGKPTRKHIEFALHRVRMLIHFGVKPYLVFDGDYLPSKAHTEKDRAARRKESKRLGLELLRMGRSSQAHLELQKAIDVTPAMARELIEELKRLDVPYVVAPYEADSQLAYLEKQGVIQGVVSEDSDLLVFGVKCLLTKLDQYGECVMINRADFTACRDISLVGWSDTEFRIMAMLSGCDYLPGIEKMGLKTAYRLVRKHKTIERVVRTVQFDGKMKVPAGYLEAFQNAERTFMYPWVFCPEARKLLHLSTLPTGLEASTMPFIGKHVEAEVAAGVACGDLDPGSKHPIVLPNRFMHRATRSRVVQVAGDNLKKGKPITEFFKGRIPLAELDPNSLTPISIQQARVSSAPAPTTTVFGQARTANASTSSSTSRATFRVATDPLPSTGRASPKRQRLCSEVGLSAALRSTQDSPTASSRFFAKSAPQQSPSLRKKKKQSDIFNVWSDDSIAEPTAPAPAQPKQTPKIEFSLPRKRKKIPVFTDPTPQEDTSISDISQASILTDASQATPSLGTPATPDTSFDSIATPQEERSFVNKSIKANLAALRYNATPPLRRPKALSLFASTPKLETQSAIQVEGSSHLAVPNLVDYAQPIKGSEDLLIPESPETSDGGEGVKLNLSRFAFVG